MNRILLPDGNYIQIVEDNAEFNKNLLEFAKKLKKEKKERKKMSQLKFKHKHAGWTADTSLRPCCPFCGLCFNTVEELIEHQDDEGHVIYA